jgi:hypothetical protein
MTRDFTSLRRAIFTKVRMTQHCDNGEKLVYVSRPWCDSLNEAKAVVDKLVDHVAGSGWLHEGQGIIKQP